ncbi:UNVERIFIED_CONTAM: hypothetical protein RMT77_007742 [Armadillidium vulgare]
MPPIYKISRLELGNPVGEVPKFRNNQNISQAKDNTVSTNESHEDSKREKKYSWKRHLSPYKVGSEVAVKRRRMEIVGQKISDMIQNNIRIKRAEKMVKELVKEIMELKAVNESIRKEYARIYVDLQRYESSIIVSELMAMEEALKQDAL